MTSPFPAGGHASILRNQLVTKDMVTNSVEVKSEPLSMIGTGAAHHEVKSIPALELRS